MYPNEPSNVPAVQAGYVPYFYQAGLYFRQSIGSRHQPFRPTESLESSYSFITQTTFGRPLDQIQTVEEVIQKGYFAVPNGDPITAIISDKKHTSRLGLDDVIGQIRHRYEIYNQNIYELNQAVCEANNGLFRQMADHGQLVANQRQQYSVTKQVQKIYDMQREERISLWQDVSRLRLALPENAQNYLTAHRKVSALEAQQGDDL